MSTSRSYHLTPFELASVAATLMLQPANLGTRVTYAAACKQALTLLATARLIISEQEVFAKADEVLGTKLAG
jgi:hypothetical protein